MEIKSVILEKEERYLAADFANDIDLAEDGPNTKENMKNMIK